MVESLNRFVAYICPECSGISDCNINIFDFSGNKCVDLKCIDKYCKTQAVILSMKNDKMKIDVYCPVCTQNHTFTISKNAFWSNDIITFNCPNSGISIFFAGNKKSVIDAVNENEKMFEDTEELTENLTNELHIILHTLDALHKVMNEKRLICKCGSRNLFPLFQSDQMYVLCEDCKKKYPITPSADLLDLLTNTKDDFKL